MNYLLDTDTAVAVLRGRPPAVRERLRRAIEDGAALGISSIVLYELWHGVARSDRVRENEERLQVFLAGSLEVVAFDDTDAAFAGRVRASLERARTPIGPYDVLIGGQALRHGVTLVTTNTREFNRVHGLRVEDWTAAVPRGRRR